MFCRKCGKELPDDSLFCSKCGERVKKDLTICESCGKELPFGSEFCIRCGKRVNEPLTIACTSCNHIMNYNNGKLPRFCPKCGAAVVNEKEPVAPVAVPESNSLPIVLEPNSNVEECSVYNDSKESSSNQIICPRCRTKISEDSPFCPKCGTTVFNDKEPEVPETIQDAEKTVNDNAIFHDIEDSPSNNKPKANGEDEVVEQRNHEPETEKSVQQQADSQSQSALINTSAVCFIISIAALAIALFLEYVVMANMKIESYADLTNYNAVAMFDWLFFGLAVLCFIIRVICAFILAAHSGNLSGLGGFVGIGLVITIILGIFTQAWGGVFILFGIVVALYITSKIKDWM